MGRRPRSGTHQHQPRRSVSQCLSLPKQLKSPALSDVEEVGCRGRPCIARNKDCKTYNETVAWYRKSGFRRISVLRMHPEHMRPEPADFRHRPCYSLYGLRHVVSKASRPSAVSPRYGRGSRPAVLGCHGAGIRRSAPFGIRHAAQTGLRLHPQWGDPRGLDARRDGLRLRVHAGSEAAGTPSKRPAGAVRPDAQQRQGTGRWARRPRQSRF